MNSWKCFKKVLNACLNYKGIVYGGAVRDLILHNTHAREFQTTHSNSEYTNTEISIETLGRLTIPNDIDCLIMEKDSDYLMTHLSSLYFLKVNEVNNVYFTTDQNYKHFKLSIILNKSNPICVNVDLIVQTAGELKMPCMNLDFDVNGLLLTLNGFGLNEYLRFKTGNQCEKVVHDADILCDILNNIRNKKANMIYKCPLYRFKKMMKYGWSITYRNEVLNHYINEDYEGECIICKEDIPYDMCCVNYAKCKCDLRICLKCALLHYPKLDKCSLCAEICYIKDDAKYELSILKEIYMPDFVFR